MYIKIHTPVDKHDKNRGSCRPLAEYLDKENKNLPFEERQQFFNQNNNNIPYADVVASIDNNRAKLSKDETKYYMLTVNPSQKELQHICKNISGRDVTDVSQLTAAEKLQFEKSLQDYARNVMDQYARNFNRGLTGDDILYYGKVEHVRTVKRSEEHLVAERQKHIKLEKSDLDNVSYSKLYYADLEAQSVAHGLKVGEKQAINQAAFDMVKNIPDNAILVPMPSSCGYATYTKDLADAIRNINPSLDVLDVLKCNEREKLYDLKKKGFEADKDYFNFYLSGSLPNDRPVYFVDNTLSTGTTYLHAKEAVPGAKLAVHSINEEVSIKKAKLDQTENLQQLNLPKTGDIKEGLQSHIHIIVSRKDISNTIKLSPLANAKDSLNTLPDGTNAQIGFDRKNFVQQCELTFDKKMNYERHPQHSFLFQHQLKHGLNRLSHQITHSMLPEEMRDIHHAERVARIMYNFSQGERNIFIAEKLRQHANTFNLLKTNSDVLHIQSITLKSELKSCYSLSQEKKNLITSLNNAIGARTEEAKKLNKPISDAMKEALKCKDAFEQAKEASLKSKIPIEHLNELEKASIKAFKKVKSLREHKISITTPLDNSIFMYRKELEDLAKKDLKDIHSAFSCDYNNSVNHISERFSNLNLELKKIHSNTQFLNDIKNTSTNNLYENLSNLKNSRTDIFNVNKELDSLSSDLFKLKHQLHEQLNNFHNYNLIQLEYKPLKGKEFDDYMRVNKEMEKHYFANIAQVQRAISDIKFVKQDLKEVSNVIGSAERLHNPGNPIQSLAGLIPGANEAMQVYKLASQLASANPYTAILNVAKKVGQGIVQAGMGI